MTQHDETPAGVEAPATTAPAAPAPPAGEGEATFTAVAYFHGMGEQRRFEELSRLIDALDRFAIWSRRHLGRDLGRLEDIAARLEAPRGDLARDVSYVRVRHRGPGSPADASFATFRFYEVYWAGWRGWCPAARRSRRRARPPGGWRAPWRSAAGTSSRSRP